MDDAKLERLLGAVLRIGVLASAVVVLGGGVIYLARHADETTHYGTFDPEELTQLRTPSGIVTSALSASGRGIIQLGLLLLIATPVARVVVSVAGFARQRDFMYVALTLFVLGVLFYSLFLEGP